MSPARNHRLASAAAVAVVAALVALCAHTTRAGAQTLRGSIASVMRQRDEAVRNDFTFLETASDVGRFVRLGLLVRVRPTVNYDLTGVSHPYTRQAVVTFIERFAPQYRSACGERLVITSLTRPDDEQPRNASVESVHPAGMAVDLRVSTSSACRKWVEKALIALEKDGAIEATRERHPSHYHIAVFPVGYAEYLRRNGVPIEH